MITSLAFDRHSHVHEPSSPPLSPSPVSSSSEQDEEADERDAFEFGLRLVHAEQLYEQLEEEQPNSASLRRLEQVCRQNTLCRLRMLQGYYLQQLHSLYDDINALYDSQLTTLARLHISSHPADIRVDDRYTPFEQIEQIGSATRAVIVHWQRMCTGISHNRWLRRVWPSIRPLLDARARRSMVVCVRILWTCHTVLNMSLSFLSRLHPQQLRDTYTDRIAEALAAVNLLIPMVQCFYKEYADHPTALLLPKKYNMNIFLELMAASDGRYLTLRILPCVSLVAEFVLPREIVTSLDEQNLVTWRTSGTQTGTTNVYHSGHDDQQPTSDYFSGSANSERSAATNSSASSNNAYDPMSSTGRHELQRQPSNADGTKDSAIRMNKSDDQAWQHDSRDNVKLPPISASMPALSNQNKGAQHTWKSAQGLKHTQPDQHQMQHRLEQIYTVFLEQRYIIFLAFVDSASAHRSLNQDYRPKRRQARRICWLDDCLKHYRRRWWRQYVRQVCGTLQSNLREHLMIGDGGLPALSLIMTATHKHVLQLYNDTIQSVPLPPKFIVTDDDVACIRRQWQLQSIQGALGNALLTTCNMTRDLFVIPDCSMIELCERTNVGHYLDRLLVDVEKMSQQTTTCFDGRTQRAPSTLPLGQLGAWWMRSESLRTLTDYNISHYLHSCFGDTKMLRRHKLIDEQLLKLCVLKLNEKLTASIQRLLHLRLPPKRAWRKRRDTMLRKCDHMQQIRDLLVRPLLEAISTLPTRYKPMVYRSTANTIAMTWIQYFMQHNIRLSRFGASAVAIDLREIEKLYLAEDRSLFRTEGTSLEIEDFEDNDPRVDSVFQLIILQLNNLYTSKGGRRNSRVAENTGGQFVPKGGGGGHVNAAYTKTENDVKLNVNHNHTSGASTSSRTQMVQIPDSKQTTDNQRHLTPDDAVMKHESSRFMKSTEALQGDTSADGGSSVTINRSTTTGGGIVGEGDEQVFSPDGTESSDNTVVLLDLLSDDDALISVQTLPWHKLRVEPLRTRVGHAICCRRRGDD